MTKLAEILGVHKSDISHALSPRAHRKRYIKLRKRIREVLKKLKHKRPRWGFEALERLGYKNDKGYHVDLALLIQDALDWGAPVPPVSLYWFARSCLMHPSTFLKALRGDPKVSESTRRKAERLWELYLRELREDWIR